MPPYQQGRPAPEGGFKLSSNENPFPPLPAVVEAVQREALRVNRYPAPGAPSLKAALATELDVDVDRILIGDGSASLLQQLIHAVAGPGDEVVYAWRSFEAYPGLVTVAGATSVQVPLRDLPGLLAPHVILGHSLYYAGHSLTGFPRGNDLEKIAEGGAHGRRQPGDGD